MSESWQMSAEDAEEYTQALGQVMSGGWRQIALAQRLGVPAALDMKTEAWVSERIGGYVRLGLEERRAAIKELTDPDGEFHLSNRQAADVLGVSEGTVRNDRRSAQEYASEAPALEEADGEPAQDYAPEEFAESSYEVGLDDIDWEAPDQPARFPVAPDAPVERTVADVEELIAAELDESGVFEEVERLQRIRTLRNVRLGWLKLMAEFEPEELSEGIELDEMTDVVIQVDRLVDWLTRARDEAVAARGPRKVHA